MREGFNVEQSYTTELSRSSEGRPPDEPSLNEGRRASRSHAAAMEPKTGRVERGATSGWTPARPPQLLTPERVRAAAREVREGITFCLSLPLDGPAAMC